MDNPSKRRETADPEGERLEKRDRAQDPGSSRWRHTQSGPSGVWLNRTAVSLIDIPFEHRLSSLSVARLQTYVLADQFPRGTGVMTPTPRRAQVSNGQPAAPDAQRPDPDRAGRTRGRRREQCGTQPRSTPAGSRAIRRAWGAGTHATAICPATTTAAASGRACPVSVQRRLRETADRRSRLTIL